MSRHFLHTAGSTDTTAEIRRGRLALHLTSSKAGYSRWPEVTQNTKRRSFSKAEKLRIRAAADACKAPGDIGVSLRREGIYSSLLATWRKQRQLASDSQLMEHKRAPKVAPGAAQDRRVLELEKKVERLREKLAKADLIMEVPKKLSTLLA